MVEKFKPQQGQEMKKRSRALISPSGCPLQDNVGDAQTTSLHESNGETKITQNPANTEYLRIFLHNEMREPWSEPYQIIQAAAELSESPAHVFKEYSERHRANRTKYIKDYCEELQAEGVVVEEHVFDGWLKRCAERALLVKEFDPRSQPHLEQDFLKLDEFVGKRFKYSLCYRLTIGPYEEVFDCIEKPLIGKRYRGSHEEQRCKFIEELTEDLAGWYTYIDREAVDEWLVFSAERAFLIDVPDKPEHSNQPIYRAMFSLIDDVIEEYYPESFFGKLILGPYGKRPTREM